MSEEIETCDVYFSTWLQAAMALEQALILVLLLAMLKMMREQVELEHPVFALIFQEVVVSCVCSAVVVACLVLVILIGDKLEIILMTYQMFTRLGLQFHQVSWLCITYIR